MVKCGLRAAAPLIACAALRNPPGEVGQLLRPAKPSWTAHSLSCCASDRSPCSRMPCWDENDPRRRGGSAWSQV
jgi:hypothetical protein